MSLPAATVPDARDDRPTEDAIVVLEAEWSDYERLLARRGDHSAPRLAFHDGALEITAPSFDHERVKSYLGRLVETWCLVRGVDIVPAGSWTQRDAARRLRVEPDECYVLGSERKERPDLAIEVIWTSGGLQKLEIYRQLGVREVWTWRRGSLFVHVLRGDDYAEALASEVLPGIDLQLLLSRLDRPTLTSAQRDLMAALRDAG